MIERVEFKEYYMIPEIIGNVFSEDELEEMISTLASNYMPRLPYYVKSKELNECGSTVVLYPFERSENRWILPIYCKQKSLIKVKKERLCLFLVDVCENYIRSTYRFRILVSKKMSGVLFCNGQDINIYSVDYLISNHGTITGQKEARSKLIKDLEKINELYEGVS